MQISYLSTLTSLHLTLANPWPPRTLELVLDFPAVWESYYTWVNNGALILHHPKKRY